MMIPCPLVRILFVGLGSPFEWFYNPLTKGTQLNLQRKRQKVAPIQSVYECQGLRGCLSSDGFFSRS